MEKEERGAREKLSFLEKHFKPQGWKDWFAYGIVQILKFPLDQLFQKNYARRALVIETVAAVPGMMAGAFLHYRCLRRFIDDKGWIEALIQESQNERMHLMTFLEVVKPSRIERILISIMQGFMLVFYGVLYRVSPQMAHRFVGYTEESAIASYTLYLHNIKTGVVPNCPAPPIAIQYWKLPPKCSFIEVLEAIRLDECRHRDANHQFANTLLKKGNAKSLKKIEK